MNIVYCLPFWPYLYTPWLFRELAWMKQRGHRIAVISMGDPPGQRANLADFDLQDVPVLQLRQQYAGDGALLKDLTRVAMSGFRGKSAHSMGEHRRRAGLRQGLQEWATIKRATAFVRRHRADVIDAHWASHNALLARDIRSATGIPYALRLWGGDMYRSPSPNLAAIVADASAVCPASSFLKRILLGERPVAELPQVPPVVLGEDRIRICHHGLPESAFAKAAAPQSDDVQVVGSIGRLDPEKRHAHLVRAVAMLSGDHPGLRLTLVGGGQLQPSLEKLADELGVRDRVKITGSVPWAEVIAQRQTFHIYGHAAAVEGFSVATLEGISGGLPAVATRTGAHEQMMRDGETGHIVEIDDVDALADRLGRALSLSAAEREAMGAAALAHVREHFLFDDRMARQEAILEAVRSGAALPE